MNEQELERIAKALMAPGKGLLAADESSRTCEKRFSAVGVECTEGIRREYRQLLLTTPHLRDYLSGVIFFDETFWQTTDSGQTFRDYLATNQVMPGIKVDKGLVDLPGFSGEKITEGLDGLPDQMEDYANAGAKFAKWRALITIGEGIPTEQCIKANAFVLGRYARICQEAGIVPIVEPEVLYDGHHSIDRCEAVMARVFDILFRTMRELRIFLPGTILKTSMVLPGKNNNLPMDYDQIAKRTRETLHEHVPHELGGVVFLSGGQRPSDAFINLNRIARGGTSPWRVTFSYSRALQDPVLNAWAKNRHGVGSLQQLFQRQLFNASAASKGELNESTLESEDFVSHSQDS